MCLAQAQFTGSVLAHVHSEHVLKNIGLYGVVNIIQCRTNVYRSFHFKHVQKRG